MTTMSDYFSLSYQEARKKFLSAAQSTNGDLASFENPNRGVEGELLFTDVVLLGTATAKRPC